MAVVTTQFAHGQSGVNLVFNVNDPTDTLVPRNCYNNYINNTTDPCSLRTAIDDANTYNGSAPFDPNTNTKATADTITINISGTHLLTKTLVTLPGAAKDSLKITEQDSVIKIVGDNRATAIIDAGGVNGVIKDRVLHITSGAKVELSHLTITGGYRYKQQGIDRTNISSENKGGGIYLGYGSKLTLTDVSVTGNVLDVDANEEARGGGIYVDNGADLTLKNSSVDNNKVTSASDTRGRYQRNASGGGIFLEQSTTLTADRSNISYNQVISPYGNAYGAGIVAHGETITLLRTTVSHNTAENANDKTSMGGGIYSRARNLIIESSLISHNKSVSGANAFGGGLNIVPFNEFILNNSTVALNTAESTSSVANIGSSGGGIYFQKPSAPENGTYDINASSIVGNVAMAPNNNNSKAGGLYVEPTFTPTIHIKMSILAGNTAENSNNCDYNLNSHGNNWIPTSATCTYTDVYGSNVTTNATMGGIVLRDNGGPTFTYKLPDGSPAIVPGIDCKKRDLVTVVEYDQRGAFRGNINGQFLNCDIGAYDRGAWEANQDTDPSCSDGYDNDGNGLTDGDDSRCGGVGDNTTDDDGDGISEDDGDCDDTDININSSGTEECDAKDNDCDGFIDEGDVCKIDGDGDGITAKDGDCDDTDASTKPGAPEKCDSKDNDCDGAIDEGAVCVTDTDDDGDGISLEDGDCDDTNKAIKPGATEECDGKDNDCDGRIDEDEICPPGTEPKVTPETKTDPKTDPKTETDPTTVSGSDEAKGGGGCSLNTSAQNQTSHIILVMSLLALVVMTRFLTKENR